MNNNQLYFVFDSHCPWSYATLPLVNAIAKAFPKMTIHLWHTAHYQGTDSPSSKQITAVKQDSSVTFSNTYENTLRDNKNAIVAANVMAWAYNKQPKNALNLLNAMFNEHFGKGNPLTSQTDYNVMMSDYKLSPPAKVFKDKISNDAFQITEDVEEIQNLIGMRSFPIMLLAMDEKAVLLDHSHYLKHPQKIVEAVEQELAGK